jgi:3-oxoadipate enol-lactonase
MPKIRVNGAELYYEEHGQGKETIVFSHGLLWNGHMFDDEVNALKDKYRCIIYDHRGQGQSEITDGGYDMETVYEDGAALIQALHAAPCHFVGLSMGGFVGMRIAARRPELLKSLILVETTADPEPVENIPKYKRLNFVARWFGFGLVTNPVMKIMFGQKFLTDPTRTADREKMKRWLQGNNRIGITRAVMGVIQRKPIYDELDKIKTPTLIMVGDQDVATVPAKSKRIHERIAGSKLVTIPGAGHSSSVEEPAFVNKHISEFLNGLN